MGLLDETRPVLQLQAQEVKALPEAKELGALAGGNVLVWGNALNSSVEGNALVDLCLLAI